MVKTYLRYRQERVLGVVAAPHANIAVNIPGTLVYAPALEEVVVWNVKQGIQVQRYGMSTQLGSAGEDDIGTETPTVSRIALDQHENKFLAAGYVSSLSLSLSLCCNGYDCMYIYMHMCVGSDTRMGGVLYGTRFGKTKKCS